MAYIDTHETIKTLIKEGFDENQAKAITNAITHRDENIVTNMASMHAKTTEILENVIVRATSIFTFFLVGCTIITTAVIILFYGK